MMKDGVVLAVVFLIMAGGLFLWWTQTPTHYGAPVQDTQVQAPEPAPKPAPVVKARPKPKVEPVVEEATPAPAVEPVEVAVTPPVVRRDPPPFPAVEQILTGVHEDSITGTYGDPQLMAVTSTGGHMIETMVYARERGRSRA